MDATDSLIDNLRAEYRRYYHRVLFRIIQAIAVLSVIGLAAWAPRSVL